MAGFLGSPSLATMIRPVAVCTISSTGLDAPSSEDEAAAPGIVLASSGLWPPLSAGQEPSSE